MNSGDSELAFVREESGKEHPDVPAMLKALHTAHDSGNPKATYALGTWYLHGQHVPEGLKERLCLIRIAADRLHPDHSMIWGRLTRKES